jgi:hypothetical protein
MEGADVALLLGDAFPGLLQALRHRVSGRPSMVGAVQWVWFNVSEDGINPVQ